MADLHSATRTCINKFSVVIDVQHPSSGVMEPGLLISQPSFLGSLKVIERLYMHRRVYLLVRKHLLKKGGLSVIPSFLGVWVVFWSWGLSPEFLHAEQALDALPVSHMLCSV